MTNLGTGYLNAHEYAKQERDCLKKWPMQDRLHLIIIKHVNSTNQINYFIIIILNINLVHNTMAPRVREVIEGALNANNN